MSPLRFDSAIGFVDWQTVPGRLTRYDNVHLLDTLREQDGERTEKMVDTALVVDLLGLANRKAAQQYVVADVLGVQQLALSNCVIHRLDVRGADLGGVGFSNVKVYELLVDPFVKFGSSIPSPRSIVMYEHGRIRRERADWIERQQRKSPAVEGSRTDSDPRWRLLEKFARISMRQYAIRSGAVNEDPVSRRILGSRHWPELRKLLERHERLELVDGTAAGPKSEWFHLKAGGEFLNPEGDTLPSTRKILTELNVRMDASK